MGPGQKNKRLNSAPPSDKKGKQVTTTAEETDATSLSSVEFQRLHRHWVINFLTPYNVLTISNNSIYDLKARG